MGALETIVDPGEVGFAADRLRRIDHHFARYVEDERLPGWTVAVTRHGQLAHLSHHGWADVEASVPVAQDTIWRIYSMTKPITSVAAMMLAEEGAFELKDPVSAFIPAFADARVFSQGSSIRQETVPATEPVRVWHLLTHTSGLTYGFHNRHPTDAAYRAAGFEWGTPPGFDNAACCAAWAALPLAFQPGTEWNYGVSTDVLGHLVEVVSGQTLDEFFAERILGPLGMTDTGFWVPEGEAARVAALYVPNPADGKRLRLDGLAGDPTARPAALSGGGGLYSTIADYLAFCEMLRRKGAYDGGRLLGSRTVEYMTRNHLPGGVDLEAIGRPLFSETTFDGVGFGLGFAVVDNPVENKVPGSAGEFNWGGAASTAFWVDPVEDITVVFMTQLLPSSTHPIRSQLKALVHQALVD